MKSPDQRLRKENVSVLTHQIFVLKYLNKKNTDSHSAKNAPDIKPNVKLLKFSKINLID